MLSYVLLLRLYLITPNKTTFNDILKMKNYLVCTIKSWNVNAFAELTPGFHGKWHLISDKDELTLERLEEIRPRYIFFPHWSWIVPDEILEAYECVCFHMTDVPYGRGGSPLQNLIVRGHQDTKLTALRMTQELDAGPVYKKTDLSLDGTAAEILERAGRISYAMMKDISENEPVPVPQKGEPTIFKRRTPEMGAIPADASLEQIYDYIRMLDGEGYPAAYINHGPYKIEFSKAKISENELTARVSFKKKDGL